MNAKELADAVKGAGDNSFNDQASRMLLLQQAEIEELKAEKLIHDEAYISQMKEIQKLKERIKFLEDKAIMVDNSETEFGFQSLFGEDMLEVNQRITNMLRSMVNEEFEKELKKAKEK